MAQIPALPLDVIRETLNHLPSKDLLKCQRVCSDFRQLVQNSNDLQLRMHLEDSGIRPVPYTNIHKESQPEVERLREIESRLAAGDFGSSDPKHKRLRLSEGDPEAFHFITTANGYLFTPWQYGGNFEGMAGIARYQLDDLSLPPHIWQFEKPVRHYQIDPAEGVLLVVFLEDGLALALRTYTHSIRLYDVDSLEPLKVPSIDAEFSAGQMCHPLTQIHIRGHFLAITCEGSRGRPDRLEFATRLINWKTGHTVQDHLSGSVTPRILSSRALALLETNERNAALHIIAYRPWSGVDEGRSSVVPVGRYELPELAANRILLNGYLECSPVSLDLQRDRGASHHLLADGEGIVAITLETMLLPALVPGGPLPTSGSRSWSSTTCCPLIRPFHDWAKDSLSRPQEDPVDRIFPFRDWAPSTLSWIQPHSVRPTRDSLCGYRFALVAEAFNDLDSMLEGLASLEQQTLGIVDLNPVRIKKERHMAIRGEKPSRYLQGLEVLPLSSQEPVAQDSSETAYLQSDNSQAAFKRVLITRAAPTANPTVFQKESREYATEAPYMLLVKRITINPSSTSFVCQISHNALLLTQLVGAGRERRIQVEVFSPNNEARPSDGEK